MERTEVNAGFPGDIAARLLAQTAGWSAVGASLLPSTETVISLTQDLQDLLFPGVRRAGSESGGLLSAERQLTERLQRVAFELRGQVVLALRHVRQATLRLHDEPWRVQEEAERQVEEFLRRLPGLHSLLMSDVNAAFEKDPAARTRDEIVLCYPGIQAISVYRLAHELQVLGVPYLPRMMTEWAHRETGIDIHPGAEIGGAFFIDHGTGVVIGETCRIGEGVTLYQGVTLGAWSFPRDEEGQLIRGARRHPTLEDRVTVYSNATILGGTTVVGAGSQIGSSVSLNRSVPANTIVTIERPSLKFREAA